MTAASAGWWAKQRFAPMDMVMCVTCEYEVASCWVWDNDHKRWIPVCERHNGKM